ncbi:MAG: hypothetical protein R3A47_04660 [Polyangiales bacterium]
MTDYLKDETGTIAREAEQAIALVYPSPYRSVRRRSVSKTLYRIIYDQPNWRRTAHFSRRDDAQHRGALTTLELNHALLGTTLLAFSVSELNRASFNVWNSSASPRWHLNEAQTIP